MNTIQGISSQPKQRMTVVLDDRSTVSLYLEYRPQQLGWFADLTWGSRTINGLRITCSPNILQKYQHLLPFGLAVVSKTDAEPLNATDFADGTATVYLLNKTDVASVNAIAFTGS